MKKHLLRKIFLALSILGAAAIASAQDYPTKPVRILVGYPAGGATDISARIVAQRLSVVLGQPVVVDNRAGASGNIAADMASRAPADGYTLLWIPVGTSVSGVLYPGQTWNLLRDFAPVTQATSVTSLLVVHPSLPVHSVKDFLAYVKANPGINYSSSGMGGSPHLAAEWFKSMAKIDMLHIPYKGTAPQLVDLLAGVVKVGFPNMPGMVDHIRGGKLRALAVTSAKRHPIFPDLPTLAESGFPEYHVSSWSGVVVPAGTPRDVVRRLHKEIVAILEEPEVRERLAGAGADAAPSTTPEHFGEFIRSETAKWSKVIHDAKIKPE